MQFFVVVAPARSPFFAIVISIDLFHCSGSFPVVQISLHIVRFSVKILSSSWNHFSVYSIASWAFSFFGPLIAISTSSCSMPSNESTLGEAGEVYFSHIPRANETATTGKWCCFGVADVISQLSLNDNGTWPGWFQKFSKMVDTNR